MSMKNKMCPVCNGVMEILGLWVTRDEALASKNTHGHFKETNNIQYPSLNTERKLNKQHYRQQGQAGT